MSLQSHKVIRPLTEMLLFTASLLLVSNFTQPALKIDSGWTLYCGGDIMLNGVSPKTPAFRELRALVPARAIFVANLEIPLTNTRESTPQKTPAEVRARDQYILKANPAHINNLKGVFDVVSLGNNHSMDGGPSGLKQSNALLGKAGIKFSGAGTNRETANRATIIKAPDGTRVAFLSYLSFLTQVAMSKCTPATSKPGIATLSFAGRSGPAELKTLKGIIANVKKSADVVVVSAHWGVERQPLPAAYQVSLGRLWIDAGADVVLGSHPHVLQPGELYRGKPIIYSLGNLVNPGSGQCALYKFVFSGRTLKSSSVIPLRYSGGTVKRDSRGIQNFLRPQTAFANRYPSPFSKSLLVPALRKK